MNVLPIEGITPELAWNTAYVVLAVIGIVIVLDKLNDIWIKRQDRKRRMKQEQQAPVDSLDTRLKDIEKRLDSIDDKLSSDKRRLDRIEAKQASTDDGFRALCQSNLALLNHELHNGNGDEMEAAQKALQKYLIEK